jgi:hypothetical protein
LICDNGSNPRHEVEGAPIRRIPRHHGKPLQIARYGARFDRAALNNDSGLFTRSDGRSEQQSTPNHQSKYISSSSDAGEAEHPISPLGIDSAGANQPGIHEA